MMEYDELINICDSMDGCIDQLQIITLVERFFKGRKEDMKLWFHCENPLLGNTKPIDMMNLGRAKKLLNFINSCIQTEKLVQHRVIKIGSFVCTDCHNLSRQFEVSLNLEVEQRVILNCDYCHKQITLIKICHG